MTVTINGEPRELANPATVAELLAQLEMPARGIAVEVNLQILSRTRFAEYVLADGDRLEIVSLVGGG